MLGMTRALFLAFMLAAGLGVSTGAFAAVGVTDNCQEDIHKLEDEMERDKDDYTTESRAKAQTQLTAAKTNRLNPAKCRKNLQDARQELRKGKRDKRDD
jgi:hypothetical protein